MISSGVIDRLREIGIRTALGATPADVMRDVVGRALSLAAASSAIGAAIALGVSGLVRSLLYGLSTTDPVTFAGVVTMMMFTAVVASLLPAPRAVGVDPTVALRNS